MKKSRKIKVITFSLASILLLFFLFRKHEIDKYSFYINLIKEEYKSRFDTYPNYYEIPFLTRNEIRISALTVDSDMTVGFLDILYSKNGKLLWTDKDGWTSTGHLHFITSPSSHITKRDFSKIRFISKDSIINEEISKVLNTTIESNHYIQQKDILESKIFYVDKSETSK